MDGDFVPEKAFERGDLDSVLGKLPVDVHFMVRRPAEWNIKSFLVDGVEWASVHAEALRATAALEEIAAAGKKAGLAFNPGTQAGIMKLYDDLADYALVMGVQPGRGGQEFDESVLAKITELSEGYGKPVSVDGGLNASTGPECVRAGAQRLCSGNYLFNKLSWNDEATDKELVASLSAD